MKGNEICHVSFNNNNNTHICIAPYGRNFRGTVARECASE